MVSSGPRAASNSASLSWHRQASFHSSEASFYSSEASFYSSEATFHHQAEGGCAAHHLRLLEGSSVEEAVGEQTPSRDGHWGQLDGAGDDVTNSVDVLQ